MDFFLRFMGWIAKSCNEASRSSVGGVRPAWSFIVFTFAGAFYFAMSYLIDQSPTSIWGMIGCFLPGLIVLISVCKHNTFFVKTSLPVELSAVNGDAPFQTKLRWTGRLQLAQQHTQFFNDVPATATRMKNGTFAVVSRIDASMTMYGLVVANRNGLWVSIPQPLTLQVEVGTLYYGFRGIPALNLRFVDGNDNKKARAVMSFDSAVDRNLIHSWLIAEKQRLSGSSAPGGVAYTSGPLPFSRSTNL